MTPIRACAPSKDLRRRTWPVLAAAEHGAASPLPYGLGVYAVGAGEARALPLVYVSAAAAMARARGVRAGWYVAAEPGAAFELRVTATAPQFPGAAGRALPSGHAAAAVVCVDGVEARRFLFDAPGDEAVLAGFVESMSYAGGSAAGSATCRQFRFARARTSEDADAAAAPPADADAAGCITVQVFAGRAQPLPWTPVARKFKLAARAAPVAEKVAAKAGRSIEVARDGAAFAQPLSRAPVHVPDGEELGSFVVFLRERFWMESRRIIDPDGNPWVPKTDPAVVGVVEVSDAESEEKPPRKKVKLEVVDLTLVRDSIDLTGE